MFDITNVNRGNNTTVNFNSVSGTLVKSCPESKFIRFHQKSELADQFFDINLPHRLVKGQFVMERQLVHVLQVMLCGGDNFMVEYIDVDKEGV